jgi:Glycosyl transferase family 2
MADAAPIPVLINSHNRPVYLWASLDSLYRYTRQAHEFVLLDLASDDPLVDPVIRGFERRGMFARVIRAARNDAGELWQTIWSLTAGGGEFIALADSDVIVEDIEPCWLGRFVAHARHNPRLAMVGAAIDKSDFVTMQTARALEPGLDDEHLAALVKRYSNERSQDPSMTDADGLLHAHSPPGRLLLLRSAALRAVGPGEDGTLDQKFRDAGYDTGIAADVRHRHLSLLHLFDYPDYDIPKRDAHMAGHGRAGERHASEARQRDAAARAGE